jgi:hypothetical protein
MFYIINKDTNKKFKTPSRYAGMWKDTWKSKAAATRAINSNDLQDTHVAIPCDEYKPNMVQRRNLMSGELYMEAEDTPNYCSPASEAYWSM